MIKKAFTLIELIFIIILIGILSSVAASYFRDDKLALATYQVLEHIRYTQHLAISQHKFTPKDTDYSSNNGQYHLARWQIRFVDQPGTPYILGYAVYSDADRNRNIDVAKNPTEVAFNPFGGESTIAGNDGKDGALVMASNDLEYANVTYCLTLFFHFYVKSSNICMVVINLKLDNTWLCLLPGKENGRVAAISQQWVIYLHAPVAHQ